MSEDTKALSTIAPVSFRVVISVLVAVSLAFALSCGGGGAGNGGSSSPPTVTSVTVSCNPTSVQTGQASQCTATVTGTGNYSSTVTWSASAGTINSSGLLTAPNTAGSVTVTATSTQDATKSGTANVTVTAPPGTPPNLFGNWLIQMPNTKPVGYLGATTAGFTLEASSLCEQVGLGDSTACYQSAPSDYPIEWVSGPCNGGNGTNPYVSQFVMGQSLNKVEFQLNAYVLTSALGSAPDFSVTGTGTITQNGSQFQMNGTWAVSKPTSACQTTSGTWSATQVQQ